MSLYTSPSLFLWACFFRLVTDLPEIAGPPEQSLTVPAYFLLCLLPRWGLGFYPCPARLCPAWSLVPFSVPFPLVILRAPPAPLQFIVSLLLLRCPLL